MSDRYKQVKLYQNFKFYPTSPIDILKGAIYIDNITNKAVFQLKFVNMQDRNIKAVYIAVVGYDDLGKELENKEYQYLDLNIKKGQEFGTDQLKELSNNTIRNIDITINKVIYANNEVWENKNTVAYDRTHLKEIDKELLSFANRKAKEHGLQLDTIYYPMDNKDYWTCVCGTYNSNDNDKCYKCTCKKKTAFNIFNVNILKTDLDNYKIQEEAKNKKLKICIISLFIIFILSLIIFLLCSFIPKNNKKIEYQLFNKAGYYALLNKNGYVVELSHNKKDNIPEIFGNDSIDIDVGNKLNVNYKEKFDNFCLILELAKQNNIESVDELYTYQVSETEFEYLFIIESENKKVELGNTENLTRKFEYIKALLDKEKGKTGTIYVYDIEKVYFKEDV